MTLVELMVASAVAGTVATAVLAFGLFSARSFTALGNYIDMHNGSRPALDLMVADIRQANGCSTSLTLSPVRLTLVGTNVVNSLPYTLTYSYDTNGLTLWRTYVDAHGSETKELLTGCTSFALSYFQRNPTNGTYDVYPVDDPSHPDLCKLIQITWTCSRTILGKPANSESVQSARVVIRKG